VNREYFEKFLDADYDLKLYLREMSNTRQCERTNAILEMQNCLVGKTVYRNDFIFNENDPGGDLYLLDEGYVDVTMNGQKVFSVRKHGDIFGEHSLIGGQSRGVSAQCKSERCKLHVLTARDFESIVDSHPSMKKSLRNLFSRREFQKAVCLETGNSFPEDVRALREAFDSVDKNHSGKLELENIRSAIKKLDPSYTEDDVIAILKSLDLDESGEVSWAEFKRLFDMEGAST
jgi:signal-transduction protein with cAMP-binding, CBS, and nucleotidyltransferase domain